MDFELKMKDITDRARKAAVRLAVMSEDEKNKILLLMADELKSSREDIQAANELDIANSGEKGKNAAFLDRLRLDDKRIEGMCAMMKEVAVLRDPVGDVLETVKRPNGLRIEKVRIPIGVIGIIYESRPNVTADCVSLCLKSGNAVILRCGSDSINSNSAIYKALEKASAKAGVEEDLFILIEDTSREMVEAMLKATGGIDLVMPRGGESLIREVVEKSRIPVIKHYKGICHTYVDIDADLEMAKNICLNAKVQRPGVCNAMETMLVHAEVAEKFIPEIASGLREKGVILKGCDMTRKILGDIEEVSDEDYATEWLDLVLNIRIVGSMD